MANVIYDDKLIENKVESILKTNVAMNDYVTVDNSMVQGAGMTKTIRKRTVTGSVQDLAQGEGNTTSYELGHNDVDYTVKVTQGKFHYYDEEVMKDPTCVDDAINYMIEDMTNDLNAKIMTEWSKATKKTYGNTWTFDNVVDAKKELKLKGNEALFMMINKNQAASMRKSLKDSLQYSEDYVRTGYIGTVAGIKVIENEVVPDGVAYIGASSAATLFMKKGNEIEQEREANTRKNTVYSRKCMVVALTDENKVVKMFSMIKPTITAGTYDVGNTALAGTCAAGSTVKVSINGATPSTATVTSGAWSYTATALVAGDTIDVTVTNGEQVDTLSVKVSA